MPRQQNPALRKIQMLPSHPEKCPFEDVAVSDPNIDAITWAQENGYLDGYGNGVFGSEDSMTVEQAMVMIYRFFSSPFADQSVLNSYEDGDLVSSWAKDAMAWTDFKRSVPAQRDDFSAGVYYNSGTDRLPQSDCSSVLMIYGKETTSRMLLTVD